MTKPTIVLVPGAWHKPIVFKDLIAVLESHSYHVIPVSLPSCGPKPGLPDALTQDISAIRKAVSNEVLAGRNVLILCHSYGGFPSSRAFEGLTRKDRESQNLEGGVVCLAMMAAFCGPAGESLYSIRKMAEGHSEEGADWWPDDWERDDKYPELNCWKGNVEEDFYGDLDPEIRQRSVQQIVPFSNSAVTEKGAAVDWTKMNIRYLLCENDMANVPTTQEAIVGMLAAFGANVVVERIASGHSPFLGRVDETAQFVRRAAGEEGL